ncbi:MAG: permease [Deltaproteobacteria bacterium]|nr:permease [Deltaproteobacteria bacterium]
MKAAARSAWGDFRGVLGYLLVGVAIGAGIHGYVPQQLVADLAGPDNPLAIPTAAVIGVPLYIRGTTVIPIGCPTKVGGLEAVRTKCFPKVLMLM